ncbi:hypothetical protein [Frankia sp. AgB32]|uniref:hypothetical protein n=1 Tax=Frankia sp. AgB32 TaxID=631119 RepID=UPI00200BE314|nr:hypothetical protein [Frankia sp. AgB32]MCK9895958.1 hypothetical protein [Frankia sp. AgB32]
MKSTARFSTSSAGTPIRSVARQLSLPLVGLCVVMLVAGIASGGLSYRHRSPVREGHSAGTAAWWPHLGVLVLCVVFLGGAWLRCRRVRPTGDGRLFLLMPLGRSAARRLRRTMSAARRRPAVLVRLAAAVLPAALLLYSCWRVGDQVLGGLDPNFTVNAWGGPTYLGAMACHYLDAVAMAIPAVWLLDRLLLPDGPTPNRRRGRDRRQSGSATGQVGRQEWARRARAYHSQVSMISVGA